MTARKQAVTKRKRTSEPVKPDMGAVASVERDLAKLPADLAESSVAAGMLAMARCLDDGRGSPSECMKALTDAWSKLRELAPPRHERHERTELDEITDRRRRKLAGKSGA
jgi:hypothetical protein